MVTSGAGSPSGKKKGRVLSGLKEYSSQIEDKSKRTNPNSEANSSLIRSRLKGKDDLMMDSDDDELVKLGVDMSQLSDYMDNIVKVVN